MLILLSSKRPSLVEAQMKLKVAGLAAGGAAGAALLYTNFAMVLPLSVIGASYTPALVGTARIIGSPGSKFTKTAKIGALYMATSVLRTRVLRPMLTNSRTRAL